MAESPTHKFGQIIGDVLESAMEETLREFVGTLQGYYLDKKGPRRTRGQKSKVSWVDKYGNSHDLDFVIERNGTAIQTGIPVAFIESAWRRYTKHSRNKAQEIQGAILPLAETYSHDCPFLGIIIAGDFTQGSLTQLNSLGFTTLYFDYDTIKEAFRVIGIDAHFDEATPDAIAQQKVDAFSSLSPQQIIKLKERLKEIKREDINDFIGKLRRSMLRRIETIRIIALHGREYDASNLDDAIKYIANYNDESGKLKLAKFEIYLRYNNGDRIDANFQDKETAITFLNNNRFRC